MSVFTMAENRTMMKDVLHSAGETFGTPGKHHAGVAMDRIPLKSKHTYELDTEPII